MRHKSLRTGYASTGVLQEHLQNKAQLASNVIPVGKGKRLSALLWPARDVRVPILHGLKPENVVALIDLMG